MSVDPEAPVTPPSEPAAAAPAPVNPGPWAADLATYFGDNQEAIAAADRYMREKVQPRITQLEDGTKPARELYDDLLNDPQNTLAAVVSELYGEEVGTKFAALFGEEGEGAPAGTTVEQAVEQAAAATADEPPEWAKPILEDYQSRKQREADEQARTAGEQAYQEVLADLRKNHADLTDADMELIHPFMAAAGGDPEAAYAGYQAYKEQVAKALGVEPAAPEPVAEPPAVLPSAGTTPPPVQKNYPTLDAAMDDWFAERRAASPPPVI